MTVISGYVQLMADAADPKKRHEYAEEVLKQFDVLTGMQREVLEFARGEHTLFLRRVYLHKFFGDLRRQLELELSGKPIEVQLDIDTKIVARSMRARCQSGAQPGTQRHRSHGRAGAAC
jgi:signal transduction histidine kinase